MKRFVILCLILSSVLFSVSAENIYSIGTTYIFFNEYSTYKDIKTESKLNGIGFDFSYRRFSAESDYTTDFDINADDGSFFYTNKFTLEVGFWYSLNVNFPLAAKINKDGIELSVNNKKDGFFTVIVDNICGASLLMNLTPNFFIDISLGPKVGFFYINYEHMTNLTLGVGMELGGRYYFNNEKNSKEQMGFGFGSKVSYDFYSIAQAYYPEDYSNYGIFSITPFISFVLKN